MSDLHDPPHTHGSPGSNPSPPPVEPASPLREDAGAQALAEALRSSFVIVKVLMVVLVVVFLGSGLRIIEPQEQAVKLRFGKPVGEGAEAVMGPGAHWSWPFPIDEVVKIPMGEVQTVNSSAGWYYVDGMETAESEPNNSESLDPLGEGYVITGDSNIIHTRATAKYRVTDLVRFRFDFADAQELLTNALNNAIFFAASQFAVDAALTKDVSGFTELVRSRFEQTIKTQQLGVTVDQFTVRSVAPGSLKAAFRQVGEADTTSSKALYQVRSFESEVLGRARGEASARIAGGISESNRLVSAVAAEARKFTDLLPSYESNPRLFIQQRQTETLQRVFGNVQEKMLMPRGTDGKPLPIRLLFNRDIEEPPDVADANTPK